MHADPCGIRLHANGSCIKVLCDEQIFSAHTSGGAWQDRLNEDLRVAFRDFRRFSRQTKLSNTAFPMSTLLKSLELADDSST